MKKIIISLILATVSLVASAQNDNVRRVEFEIGAGFNKGAEMYGAKAEIGMYFFAETRLNVINTPFDIGLQCMLGGLDRKNNWAERDNHVVFRGSLITFVDYNLRRWKNITPFAGLGVGFAAVNSEDTWKDPTLGAGWDSDIIFDRSFVFNPRIGVEFFNHLRITLEYKWMRPQYSYFGLSIGGVLGGGQKK